MTPKKLLFICGSINQTTQMHRIARELPEHRHFFSPYYGSGDVEIVRALGLAEYTIGGKKLRARCAAYLRDHDLAVDDGGELHDYDLVFHCSDLIWPRNITGRKVILVQEGMTDPESVLFPLVKRFDFIPRWMAGTSATGLSHKYTRFCVASEGYKQLFASRGVDPAKMVVTGIPNFDDCRRYHDNDFPHKGYVLVCTSDVREVFWYEDRRGFIEKARRIAAGRPMIFKLHPNEKLPRATDEIARWAPGSKVYATGSAEQMVANCDVLVCQYSSLAHVGVALGKEVHSFFDLDELRRLMPLQHASGARNIARVARELLGEGAPIAAPGKERGDAPAPASMQRRDEARPDLETPRP